MSGRTSVAVALVVSLALVAMATARRARRQHSAAPEAPLTFVGASTCASCHPLQTARWQLSKHARSMQPASRADIAAPFARETLSVDGEATTFSRRGDTFVVRATGPGGAVRDLDVAYTLGIFPLQQYLLGLPGGRLQALGVAWDARPAPVGQRWYQIFPGSRSWNAVCADCHSTNIRKNYRPERDRYETTWTDINVACEACHGAGSRHIAWARQGSHAGDDGLAPVRGTDGAVWTIDPATSVAHRSRARTSHVEIDMCARCHSRRIQLTDEVDAGQPLTDSYRPSLLDEGLYFADGQINAEVYEYGSFLQSRMYLGGVTCGDCHEPHKPDLISRPDETCRRCHPSTFATPAHHHHARTSPGSSCVACHMPARTLLAIDVRHDHSFRVPRPDLTLKIGSPNACASCHANRPASWAAATVRRWFGSARASQPHYGEALAAGWSAAPDAKSRLLSVVDDPAQPPIVRATALSLLARCFAPDSTEAVERATHDLDPLMRLAAVDVLKLVPEWPRALALTPLLVDPARAVRIEASRALGANLAEWTAAQRFNGDTASAHVNLGLLYAEHGDFAFARQEYETAQRLEPSFSPAAVKLADLYRAERRDEEGERVLREALGRTPDVAALHEALGLVLVRRHDLPAAIAELRRATELDPRDPDLKSALNVALDRVVGR